MAKSSLMDRVTLAAAAALLGGLGMGTGDGMDRFAGRIPPWVNRAAPGDKAASKSRRTKRKAQKAARRKNR